MLGTNSKEKIKMIFSEAKELLSIFEDIKENANVNNKSIIFKHIDKSLIAKNILPYMSLEDIVNFRSTCKDINSVISSTTALVSYSKSIKPKKYTNHSNLIPKLKNLRDLNEIDDIELELESVKRV